MENHEMRYFKYMGVKVDNVNYDGICKKIKEHRDGKGYICVSCVHTVMYATKDKKLLEAINGSLLSIADGTPLAWYGKLMGCKTIQRVSGPELMKRLLEEQNGFRHFLLGDTEQTIGRVVEIAKSRRKNVQISGHSPPFKVEFNEDDNERILDIINKENPDITWVSFGAGKQDKWMHQNIHKLNRGMMIGVGAAFKWYIRTIKAPKKIFQDLGLQWFFRMIDDPIKVGRSQIRVFPKFIIHFPFELIRARKKAKKKRITETHLH